MSKYSEEQVIGILKEHDAGLRRPQAEGSSGQNRKLKKLLTESMLDVSTLREMLGKHF